MTTSTTENPSGSFLKLFSRAMPNEFTFIMVALKAFIPAQNERMILLLGFIGAIAMVVYAPTLKITSVSKRILLFFSCIAWVLIIEPGPANELLQQIRHTGEDQSNLVRLFVGIVLIFNVIVYGVADIIEKAATTPSRAAQSKSSK